ncbi:Transcription-repair coupling factor [hydrothermal vent metagenome]|uniref:Transcription-repair coupling factor n=1 Tax=hydrothermal vent metagenome TaxID=652676 RepID=A0A1W1C9H0_9ZZZZ
MIQSNIYEYLLLGDSSSNDRLLVCKNDKEAIKASDTATLLDYKTSILPDLRLSKGDDLRSFQGEIFELLEALHSYYSCKKKKILISPVRTLLMPLPKEEFFKTLELEFASTIKLTELKDTLYHWGYHFVDIVTQKGEVSFRGDIIDIYPLGGDSAYRISLFDEEIESIREFSVETQKSLSDELESIKIIPAFLGLDANQYESLKRRVEVSTLDSFVKDIDSLGFWYLNEFAQNYVTSFDTIFVSSMHEELDEIYSLDKPLIYREDFNLPLVPKAKKIRELEVINPNAIIKSNAHKKIKIIAKNESTIRGSELESFENLEFIYKDIIVNLISDKEVIISLNKPVKRKKVKRASIILDELKLGDFVVHENHGVGLFRGIEKRVVLGATREFVVLLYQNEDTLLIPVENLNVIDRYVADSGGVPILDKMGKASFKKLRGKVKEKLFAIASEIINISAQRHLKKGIVLKRDETHALFMSQAGFIHTEDQEEAINSMLDEMASGRMMDRLLSADVGFGKTEVAMNGMYIAWKNGYQSMMVAPTTLLSSQHFKSMQERFGEYDIKIGKLDRFTTGKEKTALLKGLQEGTVDMVVGTHALLKAKFKNLAFIIIDEEHKFGVKQKEALKEIAIDVHLLSMSATPIPRSLNMALSQVKSFSEILTPPVERQGVRTFVKSYDEKIVKEAITREMRRGGQIFYVFNSIAQIEEKRKVLLELMPKLRVAVLHSKISAKQTEKDMMLFEEGEYDVMLSTSIVESGIHMPKANTMIVDGADRFGIADLHQLRGRVGRGGKEGYCYFMVEDKEYITEDAKRRLLALESHSELGSGAVLAFHDLEIRGGGNIIGEAQSGHIKQIGYSLYLRMLEDAIKELSGTVEEEEEFQVDIKLTVDAYLNEELIEEDRLRLELYRRLSQCETKGEVYEIEKEIADRFGKLDVISRQFIDIMVMKVLAREQRITKVANAGERVFIEFADEGRERVLLKSYSKDDDDLIATAMEYLKKK